ncbi:MULTISPECIES: CHAT domain-containing protein [Streptomyces]|uniref:CHAT domain-containing protein n=1 Tax=Streptomyces lycopersici TaxID=2974589 RepID=UPI0021D22451|nr:CHAT domain-containing protein [Streptomyces sp. NEAU-383]
MRESRERLLARLNRRVIRFEITGHSEPVLEPTALDESACLLTAVNHAEDDIEVRTAVGRLHWHRYALLDSHQERKVAAALLRPVYQVDPDVVPQGLAHALPPHARTGPARGGGLAVLNERLDALMDEHQRTGSLATLDEAIRAARSIVRLIPAWHAARGPALSILTGTLQARYSQTGDLGSLAMAIYLGQRSLEILPEDPRVTNGIIRLHGENLELWSARTNEPAVTDHAVNLHRRAVELARDNVIPGDSTLGEAMSALSGSLATRAELTGELSALEESISISRKAHELRPPDGRGLTNLAHKLHIWYLRTRDTHALEEACRLDRKALGLTPRNHVYRCVREFNLATVLRDRAERSRRCEDLDEAIGLFRTAIAAADGWPQQGKWLGGLASAMRLRFDLAHDPADLKEAIRLMERALAVEDDDHPERPGHLTTLRDLLVKQVQDLGEAVDPDHLIQLAEAALAATPDRHPDWPVYLSGLGDAFRYRYQRTGDPADMDRAVELCVRAIELLSPAAPNHDICLFNKASALRARFDHTGDLAALDEAIDAFGASSLEADPLEKPMRLALLGAALRARFDRTRDRADLEGAIEAGREAAQAAPRDAITLNSLENALQAWAEVTGDAAPLREAVAVGRRATEAIAEDHPDRALFLLNLGNTLRLWSQGEGGEQALEEAVRIGRQALRALPEGHPLMASARFNFAASLRTRSRRTHDEDALREAIAGFRAVADTDMAPPLMRISAAAAWGQLAADGDDWQNAYDGLTRAVEMLPFLAPRELDRASQEYGLRDFPGLASLAAACALQLGLPERAVELLEQGRGLLIAQALETKTADLSELRTRDAALADAFERLRNRLNRAAPGDATAHIRPSALAHRRRELLAQWNELIARIRDLRGLEYFGRPSPVGRLLPRTADESIVMVNFSRIRCDALILTTEGVRGLPLPGLTPRWASEQIIRLQLAVDQIGPDTTIVEQRSAGRAVLSVLADLWDIIAEPILDELDLTHTPATGLPWPRIWWVPTGPLNLLPLHAAGHHGEFDRPNPRTTLDRAVSSYLPTLHALEQARSRTDGRRHNPGVLVAALSDAPGAQPLPGAAKEATLLQLRFPHARTLRDHNATRDAVLHEIPRHPIAHFACHATATVTHPSRSHLRLHDGPLSVAEISDQHLVDAQLAYLSACATTRTDTALIDEAIHITSAFQLAGYAHVIGTLWPIADDCAAELADVFYAELIRRQVASGITPAALALHNAVREIRRRYPATPALWASHLHTGP